MEQDLKELLLIDLCARLTYGVKVFYKYKTWDSEKFATSIRLADGKIALSSKFEEEGDWFPIEEAGEILIKPYLRPMSSMTEEEYNELEVLAHGCDCVLYTSCFPVKCNAKFKTYNLEVIDWLNKKMLDYRGLIEKSLALEAPENMYNLKNK